MSLKYAKERRALILLLCLAFLMVLIMVIQKFNLIKFCICMVFIIIFTNQIELLASSLLAKIISPRWDCGFVNAGFLLTVSSTFGRIIGSVMLTLTENISGDYGVLLITYGFCALCFFITILTFAFNYSELRVKAIARILKSQNYNKI